MCNFALPDLILLQAANNPANIHERFDERGLWGDQCSDISSPLSRAGMQPLLGELCCSLEIAWD